MSYKKILKILDKKAITRLKNRGVYEKVQKLKDINCAELCKNSLTKNKCFARIMFEKGEIDLCQAMCIAPNAGIYYNNNF